MTTTLTTLIDQVERGRYRAMAERRHHRLLRILPPHSHPGNNHQRQRPNDLADGFVAAVSVEYPGGEDPPEYLKRRPYTHQDFWNEDGYYDIVPREDDTDVNEIWISTKPAANEKINVIYQAHHDNTITTATAVTVPAKHHHLLRLYARAKAAEQRAAAEEASPTSNSSLLMSQLQTNARRWKGEHLKQLAKAIQAEQGRSHVVSWSGKSEESTRIY